MNKLAKNLSFLLKHYRLSASRLARQTGIQQPVVHRIAAGDTTNPKIETLLPIAQHFGIQVEQLFGTQPMTLGLPKVTTLPILNAQQVVQHMRYDHAIPCSHFITTDLHTTSRAFAYIAPDNSMFPIFPLNTALIFDPEAAYHDQDFVLALSDNNLIFRKLIGDGKTLKLKPLHGDYDTVTLGKEDQILAPLLQAKLTYLKSERDPMKDPTVMQVRHEDVTEPTE